jgi:hypothetical protein
MKKLGAGKHHNAADQCREWGLCLGSVIVGRETHNCGEWNEKKLKLIFLGKQCCVWDVWSKFSDAGYEFLYMGEQANWTLSCREWFLETD